MSSEDTNDSHSLVIKNKPLTTVTTWAHSVSLENTKNAVTVANLSAVGFVVEVSKVSTDNF